MEVQDELAQIGPSAEALRQAGFVQIPRLTYLERGAHSGHPPDLADAGTEQTLDAAAMLALYTASRSERVEIGALTEKLRQMLNVAMLGCLERQGTAVPMKPLYSLPREANNIQAFLVSRAEELEVDEEESVIRGPLKNARVKVAKSSSGQQQLLFFDRDLVVKDSGARDTFVSVRLEDQHTGALDALIKAIEQLDIDPNVLEHLPRVCAGIFSAAQRDRRLKFNWPGTFWDTEAGSRLCRICGFDPENKRHRKRIQDVRKVLETIILHREVRGRDASGRTADIAWSGPLIEARKAELTLRVEHREGMSEHHTFQSWSIARELWEMVLPETDGGTPAFMVIDQRAFQLSERTSRPFNLYWTLINRAYMGSYTSVEADRVSGEGRFCPKLGTLYNWSGLEASYQRPSRLKRFFRETLELMVQHGLLREWSCEALDSGARVTSDELRDTRVEVVFSSKQLDSLRTSLALDGD